MFKHPSNTIKVRLIPPQQLSVLLAWLLAFSVLSAVEELATHCLLSVSGCSMYQACSIASHRCSIRLGGLVNAAGSLLCDSSHFWQRFQIFFYLYFFVGWGGGALSHKEEAGEVEECH